MWGTIVYHRLAVHVVEARFTSVFASMCLLIFCVFQVVGFEEFFRFVTSCVARTGVRINHT